MTLTQDRLREVLHYEPTTGDFTRLIGQGAGLRAGGTDKKGYWNISVNNRRYRAHRLAWLYVTGKWPADQIDHRDCNKLNNRWDNLREATNQQNHCNIKRHKNNKSGFKGVFWNKEYGKWQARIYPHGQQINLGVFNDPVAAHAAYAAACTRYFGEFARTN